MSAGLKGAAASSHKKENPILGGWRATALIAAILVGAAALLGWLGATGRLADLRYTNIPIIHPYPPTGMEVNALDPSNRGDLVSSKEAGLVRADFVRDGQIEIDAFRRNDPLALPLGVTGGALEKLQQVLGDDRSAGLRETNTNQVSRLVVGRLADPNASTQANWCAEERGSGTVTYYRIDSGRTASSRHFRFDNRYWLVRRGDHYLITDSQISATYD